MKLNHIYCGDCLEVMRGMEDNSVDLILTDPPYKLENHGGGKSKMWRQLCDKHIDFISNGFTENILPELERVCKVVNIILFCSNKQVSKLMGFFERKDYSTTLLVWHKPNAVPFGNGKYVSDIEYLIYIRGKNATYNNEIKERSKLFSYNYPSTSERVHPTQKPIALIDKLLQIHSKSNDIILDPFLGSGTTCVAAKELGRRYIGIEISQKYVDIANKRLSQGVLPF